jgi:hypothetical protein
VRIGAGRGVIRGSAAAVTVEIFYFFEWGGGGVSRREDSHVSPSAGGATVRIENQHVARQN